MDPVVAGHLETIDQMKFFAERTFKGDLPEEARFYQVTPGSAHIEWLAGHIALALDRVIMSAFEQPPALPESYQPIFGWNTKPSGDRAGYPEWSEVKAALDGAIARLRSHVASLPAGEFARPMPDSHPFAKMIPRRGGIVGFAAMHTCYHLGQVSTLRRAQGLPSGIAM
jgi:hypothetical protein